MIGRLVRGTQIIGLVAAATAPIAPGTVKPALSAAACSSTEAVYTGKADPSGGRVSAEFGESEGATAPLTLTGRGKDGATVWVHRGKAWCDQGASGCTYALTPAKRSSGRNESGQDGKEGAGDESASPAFKGPFVFVFARSGTAAGGPAPILVLGGVTAPFHYQSGSLDFERSPNRIERFVVPEVFYFERCKADMSSPLRF